MKESTKNDIKGFAAVAVFLAIIFTAGYMTGGPKMDVHYTVQWSRPLTYESGEVFEAHAVDVFFEYEDAKFFSKYKKHVEGANNVKMFKHKRFSDMKEVK